MTESADLAPPGAVACPYLGLLEDARTRFLFATPAHRCLSRRRPAVIDLDHQVRYCLSADFASCKRYRKPALDAARAPAAAPPPAAAPARAAPEPGAGLLSVVTTTRPAVAPAAPQPPDEPVSGATTHREIDEPVLPPTAPQRPVPDILLPVDEPTPGAWRPPGDGRRTAATVAPGPDPRTNRSIVGRRILLLVAVVILAVVLWAVFSPSVDLFGTRPG